MIGLHIPMSCLNVHCLPAMAAINSRNETFWLVAAVSERLSGSTQLLLLHSLPQSAPAGQHLSLNLQKSLTGGSFSFGQSLVLPRLMVRYSWWRQSLGVIFMAPNFPHSIFYPLSWTGTQWIVDKTLFPICTYLWHTHCKISIRLQPSSCGSMYAI